MHNYQVCRPGICCSCTVRPSAIRSLVLPDRVFPQNSSSSAHTSSHTKTSHQVQELTLLSINLICGLHKEREMRYASTLLSLFASFVTWKRPELQGRVVTESHDSDTFGDELQWVAEYSEAWLPPLGPIIYKLMAKTVSTFPTTHLEIAVKIFYCFFQLHLMISKQTTVFNQFIFFNSRRSHLECPRPFLMFGHTVLMDGLCESWPRRGVLILGVAGEELMITFGAGINPWERMDGRRTKTLQPASYTNRSLDVCVCVCGGTAPYHAVTELLCNMGYKMYLFIYFFIWNSGNTLSVFFLSRNITQGRKLKVDLPV